MTTTLGTSVNPELDAVPEQETDKLRHGTGNGRERHPDTTLQDLFNIFFKE